MSAAEAIYRAAAAVAQARGQLTYQNTLDAPRQLEQVVDVVGGFLPDVPLDAPTVMSLIIIFAFILQFYWTVISFNLANGVGGSSSSSSSSETTTTTTTTTTAASRVVTQSNAAVVVTARTQTVTPAPAPEWRHLVRDFALPNWVLRQQNDLVPSEAQRRKTRAAPLERPWVRISRSRMDEEDIWPEGQQWLEDVQWDEDHRWIQTSTESYEGEKNKNFPVYETSPRPAETDTPWPPSGGQGTENPWGLIQERPQMSIEYGGEAVPPKPLVLTSHRLAEYPLEEGARVEGAAADLLHAAEQWGNRLKSWHVLGEDGSQRITQAVLMMRCVFGSAGFCAKLDHYFRRQHDLNLAAAMMNDHHHDDYSVYDYDAYIEEPENYDYREWLSKVKKKVPKNRGPGRLYQPEEEEEEEPEIQPMPMPKPQPLPQPHPQPEDEKAPQPSNQIKRRYDLPKVQQEDNTVRKTKTDAERKKGGTSLTKKSWNIYFFMSVMAVLVFLLDASYRILRLVNIGDAGRALDDPHYNLLATLSQAIRRWDDQLQETY